MPYKNFIFIVVLIIISSSCKNKSANDEFDKFTLKVKVDRISDNTKVLLKKQEDNNTITIDSTFAENGTFEFNGSIEIPTIYGIFIDSIQGGIFPLVEPGLITIEAYRDSLYAATITGAKWNKELTSFRENSKKITSKINDLFVLVQKARSENDLEKLEELNKKMQAVNEENTQYSLRYAKTNPDSYISAMVLQSLIRMPDIHKDTITSIYNNFSEKVKQSNYSMNIAEFIEINTVQSDSIK